MRFKTAYLIFASLLIIDLSLTFIGLNFMDGIYEANNIAKFFFNYGIMGYFLVLSYSLLLLFLLTFFLYNIESIDKKLNECVRFFGIRTRRINKRWIGNLTNFGVILFSILQFLVIINNLLVIFSSL